MIKVVDSINYFILEQHKEQRDLKVTELSEQINKISIRSTKKTQEIFSYINLSLHKLSFQLGYCVSVFDLSEQSVNEDDIREVLSGLETVLDEQLNLSTHNVIELTYPEMRDNFQIWEDIPLKVLSQITLKELFCAKMLKEYLGIGGRLHVLFINVLIKLAQSARNFIDIRSYQDANTANKNYVLIDKHIHTTIDIFLWASQECEYEFARINDIFFGRKCIQVWEFTKLLYNLVGEEDAMFLLEEKSERLQQRINNIK